MQRLRQLATGATATTIATGLATQVAVLISGIAAARLLGPENRGHLALIWLITIALTQVGTLGVPVALTYALAQAPQAVRAYARSLRATILLQAIGLALVQALLLMVLFGDEPSEIALPAAASLLVLPAMVFQFYGLAVLQGRSRFRPFNILRLAPSALYAGGVLVLLVGGGASLLAVTAAWIAGYVLSAAATGYAVWSEIRDEGANDPAKESVGDLTAFGLKGMLGSFSPTETLRADQAIVGVVLSPTALGLYTTALAFTNLPRLIAQSVGLVVYPRAAASKDPLAALRLVWRFVALATAVTLVIVVILEAATPWLIELLFGAEFLPAVDATRILLIGTVFLAARRVLGDGIRGLGHPEASTYAELVSWVLLLPALLVLAATDSLEAVSAAVAASYLVSLVTLAVLSRRVRSRLEPPQDTAGTATEPAAPSP